MPKKISYEVAYQELSTILEELENDSLTVDELPKKVKKANELLRFCKEKLRDAEKEISNLMQDDI